MAPKHGARAAPLPPPQAAVVPLKPSPVGLSGEMRGRMSAAAGGAWPWLRVRRSADTLPLRLRSLWTSDTSAYRRGHQRRKKGGGRRMDSTPRPPGNAEMPAGNVEWSTNAIPYCQETGNHGPMRVHCTTARSDTGVHRHTCATSSHLLLSLDDVAQYRAVQLDNLPERCAVSERAATACTCCCQAVPDTPNFARACCCPAVPDGATPACTCRCQAVPERAAPACTQSGQAVLERTHAWKCICQAVHYLVGDMVKQTHWLVS